MHINARLNGRHVFIRTAMLKRAVISSTRIEHTLASYYLTNHQRPDTDCFLANKEGIGEGLGNMHRELEKCERALNEYLDMKKNVFPRYPQTGRKKQPVSLFPVCHSIGIA